MKIITFFGSRYALESYLDEISKHSAVEVNRSQQSAKVGAITSYLRVYKGKDTITELKGLKFDHWKIDVASLPQISTEFLMTFLRDNIVT